MLDLILIQDRETGIGLFQLQGKQTLIDESHQDLFHGFMSAFQSIIKELNLGQLSQISTIEHHCVIHYEGDTQNWPLNIIMMFDCEDSVDFWKEKAREIGCAFLSQYQTNSNPGNVARFRDFGEKILKILEMDANSCVWN